MRKNFKNLGKMLNRVEMKEVNGGFPPGCVSSGGYCVIGRPPTQAGGCCAGLSCVPPGHPGSNNEGKCQTPIT